jgi:thiol-disulfide isomerase/thioredoxin
MKKSTTTIIAVTSILAIGSGIAYFTTNQSYNSNQVVESSENTENMETADVREPISQTDPGGEYIDYTEEAFTDASGTRLLFFHASWCPQCRALDSDIKANGAPEGTTVIKVDYDNSQELRQKYGVTTQTTVVRVDDNGDLIESYVPYDDPTIANVSANLL